ncbi:Crp/Fnr family transcriptional regulator [Enterococcus xiangfangensis]|uniref:Crp/Fnr family transcriptional regulator n=1 Tax=Enterococcus xiangfangensis TaxID=1296537 RepID=UPI0010F468DC|nr:Crp/Fnr family transcriptional regulator [Enterococcus xiangfangensis]MBM7711773.1 CRP-like cAMP-binding protein [Enterococcus xiangfangensis]
MTKFFDLLNLTREQEKNFWYKKTVSANTTLLYEGDVADKIYFIEKGALRLWNNDDGKDITFQFFFEGQIVASYESFHLEKPSIFSIEAIEDTELLILDKKKLKLLIKDSTDLIYFMMDQLSERFIAYTDYFLSRIKESPEKRYVSLLEKNPELVKRVADQYIASFLGITPVSLSRIKKRIM